ncbi:MAG: LLM class flavin-dependent oxidoreductase [Actinomycetes bacterium]|jgi:alkanesulfonate monooxygenase SsuD/methylene tetrahydromethanopterin reductase-like flavin-dependent oxidoreductase (luciferase family)|nr:MAG: LLM class flavin-dependent oxidoreductase [Actinomycetota bacterium]
MRFAVDVPNFGRWADPKAFADFARRVEEAGWDGISVWDHILVEDGLEVADPWILLAAAAMVTDRVRLMTMVTPIPRRHPWKLARETVTLDLLSAGRLTLGVGLGWPTDPEFTRFGGEEDLRVRAEMLDEGLEILAGLWSGEPFGFEGRHYRLQPVTFRPTPHQQPRIPVWVAATWPRRAPVRRAARWDGIAPSFLAIESGEYRDPTPADVRDLLDEVHRHRDADAPFDVVLSGDSRRASGFEGTGVTWWRDGWVPWSGIEHDDWLAGVLEGPPRA